MHGCLYYILYQLYHIVTFPPFREKKIILWRVLSMMYTYLFSHPSIDISILLLFCVTCRLPHELEVNKLVKRIWIENDQSPTHACGLQYSCTHAMEVMFSRFIQQCSDQSVSMSMYLSGWGMMSWWWALFHFHYLRLFYLLFVSCVSCMLLSMWIIYL